MSSQQDPPPPSRGNLSPVEETGRPASVNSTGQLSSTATTAGATTYAPINTQSSSRAPLSRPRFLSIDTGASQQPSIRIRRFPSQQNIQAVAASQQQNTATRDYAPDSQVSQLQHNVSTRRRSSSEPQRLHLNSPEFRTRGLSNAGAQPYMPNIAEGGISASNLAPAPSAETQRLPLKKSRTRLFRTSSQPKPTEEELRRSEYESNLVDVLDLVDPEVSTLNTLTNVQNSLFVPQLGWLVNRRPTYTLTRREQELPLPPTPPEAPPHTPVEETEDDRRTRLGRSSTLDSITSRPDERHYAVLPHGIALEGWSPEDREELNDHVRHMLHSRRSRFKRSMKGFGQYMSKPLGFFVTLYATLITLFGLAWVLFLIGWINVGGRQDYLINIIDNIMVALFAIMGDGLAPFRAVDTYHMCFIAHYHHLTWRLRREQALPKLQNPNDLPPLPETDVEAGAKDDEYSVLNESQQKRLVHHQNKFARSHTFYKPHETTTHHAFPLRLLVAIVCLLDCHSLLQIALGTCTWAISYHVRPFALTTVILCCSITVNITAGIIIMIGDRRTRKKDVLDLMHKQELTAEAMEKVKRKREKERERTRMLDEPVPPPLSAETSKPLPDSPEDEKSEPLFSPRPLSTVARKPLPVTKEVDNENPRSPTSPMSPISSRTKL